MNLVYLNIRNNMLLNKQLGTYLVLIKKSIFVMFFTIFRDSNNQATIVYILVSNLKFV